MSDHYPWPREVMKQILDNAMADIKRKSEMFEELSDAKEINQAVEDSHKQEETK